MPVTSDAVIPMSSPSDVLSMIAQHIREEHEMELDTAEDGSKFFVIADFRVEFRAEAQGLCVRLHGPSHESLGFLKEEIVEHISEIDQVAANNIRWSGEQTAVGDLPPNFRVLKVTESRRISENLQRVTLYHDHACNMASGGTHLRLMLPLGQGRKPVWPRMAANGVPDWPQGEDKLHARFVTIKNVRQDESEVDIDIVRHAGGLISDWATNVQPDDTAGVMGPAGVERLPSRANVFLAADETGLPSIARLLEAASADVSGHVVAAASADLDVITYLPSTTLSVERLDPDEFRSEILARATELTEPNKTTYAHFAGEFQNAQELRKMFKSRLGLTKASQMSIAFWREGVPGFGS